MITGAIAWVSGHPGELTIIATTDAHAAHGQWMIEKAPANSRSYRCTVIEHLAALLRGSVTTNAHFQAQAAVHSLTTVLGAPYAILSPSGVEVSEATTFREFLIFIS